MSRIWDRQDYGTDKGANDVLRHCSHTQRWLVRLQCNWWIATAWSQQMSDRGLGGWLLRHRLQLKRVCTLGWIYLLQNWRLIPIAFTEGGLTMCICRKMLANLQYFHIHWENNFNSNNCKMTFITRCRVNSVPPTLLTWMGLCWTELWVISYRMHESTV